LELYVTSDGNKNDKMDSKSGTKKYTAMVWTVLRKDYGGLVSWLTGV